VSWIANDERRSRTTTTNGHRKRIPLRNDENHVCAGLERPPRVPVRRSSCDNVPNGQVTGCGLTTQAGSLPSPGFRK